MLPYLLFVSLMSVIGGILQTHQCFYVTAAAPVLNSCIIISALVPHWFSPVYYFSVAVSTAAIIQFCLSVFIATRKKLSVKLVIPRRNKDMKIFAKRSCVVLQRLYAADQYMD
ncbi:mviN-like family protein [Anaplasma phagocytophilum str. CRT53-1]|uniref:MviN-like family protein n=2 Tax=Anaplasma phagocytophilum TaxID=948 RepID=A0A0F3PJJ4_ANAPH|nr:mviN-like family protein [Anaplasma phagocytophilum str. CRT53-1]